MVVNGSMRRELLNAYKFRTLDELETMPKNGSMITIIIDHTKL